MKIYSVMFAAATAPLSLPSLTTGRGAAASFAAGVSLAPSGRYVARFIEIIVFAMLLALIALPAPARAQTITLSSVTATPATVRPGQTVVFRATAKANKNASDYPVEFSLVPPGAYAATTQKVFFLTFRAGAPLTEAYGWTVPAGTSPGVYSMQVAVFNPTWSRLLALKSTALTISAASVAAAPTNLEPPVVSGTAQVGQVLTSTSGTWTGATSFAYQWAGNTAPIAGATAATYTPVSSDAGHTLTATVTATGSGGATASAASAPTVPIVAASNSSQASGAVSFVALHTYYMSPTGSDSNSGTSPSSPWATPNHPVSCGDVIIAAPGSYGSIGYFGNVSNCPSTSGGIDGTGGIYFAVLLCGGTDLTGCPDGGETIAASNWAVEGFSATNPTGFCHLADGSATDTTQYAFIAFINDIAHNCADGFTTGDGGKNHDVPGNGIDEFAVVGSIAWNANLDPICVGAIDDPGPSPSYPFSGTHVIYYGSFAISNLQANGCYGHDGEGMFFDTWDAHGFTGQGVIENNIVVQSALFGIAIFTQSNNSIAAGANYVVSNTVFSNNATTISNMSDAGSNVGDINIQIGNTIPIYLYNNISRSNYATVGGQAGGGPVYALGLGVLGNNVVVGDTGVNPANSQNIFYGLQTTCPSTCLPSSTVAYVESYGNSLGLNVYEDPAFANMTDLLANRVGNPTCAGFVNTTQCMGWNANTKALTTLSVIGDLIPSASGTTGKGYQLPSTICASNPLYPTWLKGVVYLQWSGSALTENAGLVNKPCGL